MKNSIENIQQFQSSLPSNSELFHTLLKLPNIHIELIESCSLRDGELYNQEHDEWILLLDGKALVQINSDTITLHKGDYLLIQKGVPHRVLFTSKRTRWLAIHIT
jgi:cupin 2 domain-containing protein